MNYKQSTTNSDDIQTLLKKNGATLVPPPWSSSKNDVLIGYRYLPEMFERAFNNCILLENTLDAPDNEITKYQICADYVCGTLSLEDYTLYNDDDLYITYSMRIVARHMQKLGLDPDKVCENAKAEILRANNEFFVANMDNGDKVILTRGVVIKAMRDGDIPDISYLIEGHAQGDLVKFEFYNYKNRTEYMGYLLKEGRNDRQSIDFSLMDNGEKFFTQYLDDNDIEKVSKKTSKLIAEEMFVMDDLDDEVVPTLKPTFKHE